MLSRMCSVNMPYSYFDTGGMVFCVSTLTVIRAGVELICCAGATDAKERIRAAVVMALISVSPDCFGRRLRHKCRGLKPTLSNPLTGKHTLSMRSALILVGSTGRGKMVGDLRPAGMRAAEGGGQRDTGAGDLRAGSVGELQRLGYCDGRDSSPAAGSDHRRLGLCVLVDGDGLARPEAECVGNGDQGGSRGNRGHGGGSARRAHCCDHSGLLIRTRVDQDLLACIEALHARDFDVGRACSRGRCQGGRSLCVEVGAVAVRIRTVRITACTLVGFTDGHRKPSEAT